MAELNVFEKTKIQMQLVVPLIRDLQAQLGDEVVLEALQRRLDERIAKAKSKARTDVEPEKRLSAIARDFARFAGGDDVLNYEVIASSGSDHMAFDVTSCAYAKLMSSLNANDLGHLLLCSEDHVAVAGAGTRLDRAESIMQGGSKCTFRFDASGKDLS